MPMPSGFAAWVRNQIAARGYQSPEEAARALGVYPSQMLQWTRISRSPTPQVLRRVAALFDAPVQEVLIAAGFMTEEETCRCRRQECHCSNCRTNRFSTRFDAGLPET